MVGIILLLSVSAFNNDDDDNNHNDKHGSGHTQANVHGKIFSTLGLMGFWKQTITKLVIYSLS